MDLSHLLSSLQEECQLAPDGLIVVGVSGGPDSLCLLDGINQLGYPLVAAHFDHGLRAESAGDARRVEEIARGMGATFCLARADVRALAAQGGLSIEEAARKARYNFLFQEARSRHAQAVAVAHTADDQVETVLMHLLRGSGLNGLKGMLARLVLPEWDLRIPLVRPLLDVWRQETVDWCTERGLAPLYDPSNQDTAFFRNRLRHELIPYLQGYNPKVKDVVWRMASILSADWEILEARAQDAWQRCWIEETPQWVVLSLAQVQDLPRGLQRSVLRHAIARLRPALRDIDFDVVERAMDWLRDGEGGRWLELAAGLQLWIEWGKAYISATRSLPVEETWPQVPAGSALELPVPGSLELRNGWLLRASWETPAVMVDAAHFALAGEGVGRLELDAWLDGDDLRLPLVVRGLRPGERLLPLGMAGHSIKLSDFFTNRKLPQRARAAWPLLLSGDDVIWAAGLRAGERHKIGENTQRVVHLQLLKIASK